MKKQINNLSIIVFSKDRPLQLHAYLESLLNFSTIHQSCITVIYKETPFIDYSNLISIFSSVNWVKEGVFYFDVVTLINKSNDFIMFGCDDVVFNGKIDFNYALEVLSSNNKIFGFSTRLGKNIKPLPKHIDRVCKHLEWDWKLTDSPNWNYPWELDATIYRKSDVVEIVSTMNPNEILNPNFFEGKIALHTECIKKNILASFLKSKCIVITVNRVQDDFANEFDNALNTDVESLNKLYKDGIRLDYIVISKMKNCKIHVDSEYFILQNNTPLFFKIVAIEINNIFCLVKKVLRKFQLLKQDTKISKV